MDLSPRPSRTNRRPPLCAALSRIGLLVAFALATYLPLSTPTTGAQGAGTAATRPVIVVLNGGNPSSVASSVGASPRFTYSSVFRGFAANLSQQAIDALRRDPAVVAVEEDGIAMVTAQTVPTGVRRIGTTTNGTADIDGDGSQVDVDIAILDTGVDSTHPDLNVAGGKGCVSGNTSWVDDNGHGTKVAGVAAAMDNGYGVAGVAPGARIWSVKVADSGGYATWSAMICGFDWVAANAGTIDVANMSIAGGGSDGSCSSSSLHRSICAMVAAGVPLVVAAGNDGLNASQFVPAAYNEVITVGAIVDTDGLVGGKGALTGYGPDDSFASFSNYGADLDLSAPGYSVTSTTRGGGYGGGSGTSYASPHVAGAAALYLASHPNATPDQVRSALIAAGAQQTGPSGFTGDTDGFAEPLVWVGSTDPNSPGSPTPTPTATSTATATRTATATPTRTPSSTPTTSPTPTQAATASPTPTVTASSTASATQTATATPTPTTAATVTPTSTATPPPTHTATVTRTATAAATATASSTFTATTTSSATPTVTAFATNTAAPTATRTPTPTATWTPVPTATRTPTPSATPDPPTPTMTSSPSATATSTQTLATATASPTATSTEIPASPTPVSTDTPTETATATATATTRAPLARVTLSKSKSKYNGKVVAVVSGFAPLSQVTVRWPGGAVVASIQTDGSGRGQAEFRTPLVPYGSYDVRASDRSGNVATDSLKVVSRIKIAEPAGPVGAKVRIYLYAYKPGERVEIRMQAVGSPGSLLLTTVTIEKNGRGTAVVIVPSQTRSGRAIMIGKVAGQPRSASTSFTVTPPPPSYLATVEPSATATATRAPSPEATDAPPDATAVPTEAPRTPVPTPIDTPTVAPVVPTATPEPDIPATPSPTPPVIPTEAPPTAEIDISPTPDPTSDPGEKPRLGG